jgi:S1-C subfamily serine protease
LGLVTAARDARASARAAQANAARALAAAALGALLGACPAGAPGLGNFGGRWPGGIGATLRHRGAQGVLVLDRVPEGGAAARAGLRHGEVIVAVDGQPVRGRTPTELVARLRGEVGTVVVLRVRRGEREEDVRVERAPYARDAGR